jgi:hypothetical protein
MCRSACPAAFARPSIYAAKRLCCGPGEERRDPTKQFYIKLLIYNTVILDTFAMQQGGTQYRRLVGAFQRIFGATIFFGTDSLRERAAVVHRARLIS